MDTVPVISLDTKVLTSGTITGSDLVPFEPRVRSLRRTHGWMATYSNFNPCSIDPFRIICHLPSISPMLYAQLNLSCHIEDTRSGESAINCIVCRRIIIEPCCVDEDCFVPKRHVRIVGYLFHKTLPFVGRGEKKGMLVSNCVRIPAYRGEWIRVSTA